MYLWVEEGAAIRLIRHQPFLKNSNHSLAGRTPIQYTEEKAHAIPDAPEWNPNKPVICLGAGKSLAALINTPLKH